MTYAWIVAGAIVGAPLRYFVGSHVPAGNWGSFPFCTLLVNITGCLAIGFILGLSESRGSLSREARLLLVTGFLGSYTTFSAFGWETYNLLRDDQVLRASLYAGGSVVLGILAVWLAASAAKAV